LGSEVLGYDVRAGLGIPTEWRPQVGGAAEYGFHMTVCDALYFLSQDAVERVAHEVTFIMKDYAPFELSNLRVESQFPDAHSISIVGDDASGRLEALHSEFVTRIYRCASASKYTLGTASAARDAETQRAEFMIARFRAPYVLRSFRPHFTMLTMVKPDEQEGSADRLERLLAAAVPSRCVRVDELALMGKPLASSAWRITREIPLG